MLNKFCLINSETYEVIRLQNLSEFVHKLEKLKEYESIFQLLYFLINGRNIRLGQVELFMENIKKKDDQDFKINDINFCDSDVQKIIEEFLENEAEFDKVRNNIPIIMFICVKLGLEKFLTTTYFTNLYKKFSKPRREYLLSKYMTCLTSFYPKVFDYFKI